MEHFRHLLPELLKHFCCWCGRASVPPSILQHRAADTFYVTFATLLYILESCANAKQLSVMQLSPTIGPPSLFGFTVIYDELAQMISHVIMLQATQPMVK